MYVGDSDEFYCHFFSKLDKDTQLFSFKKQLPRTLCLDRDLWEVALENVQIPASILDVTEKDKHLIKFKSNQDDGNEVSIEIAPGYYDSFAFAKAVNDGLNDGLEKRLKSVSDEEERKRISDMYNGEMFYSNILKRFRFKVKGQDQGFVLSSKAHKLFGSNDKWDNTLINLQELSMPFISTLSADKIALICTNIVDTTFYGDKYIPLLQQVSLIDRALADSHHYYSFFSDSYEYHDEPYPLSQTYYSTPKLKKKFIPCKRQCIDEIQFYFLGQDTEPLKFSKYNIDPCFITLHFRKI